MGMDDEINEEIAERVFGVPRSVIEAWPWSVPDFYADRRYAAAVVHQMTLKPSQIRSIFERLLSEHADRAGVNGGIAEALITLTPDIICEAAIKSL